MDDTAAAVNPLRSSSSSIPVGSWPSASHNRLMSGSSGSPLPARPRSRPPGRPPVRRAATAPGPAPVAPARRPPRPGVSTSAAPSRISRWQPRAIGLWIEPGRANTSRPASAASRAVISAPERVGRLDHHGAQAEPDQDAVAAGEMRPQRLRAGRVLADHRAGLRRSAPCSARWRARIGDVGTGAEHRDGRAADRQGGLVRGGIDPRRQPAGDAQAGPRQRGGELAGVGAAAGAWPHGCRRWRPPVATAGPRRRPRTASPAARRSAAAAAG